MKKIKILLVCFFTAFLSCSKSEEETPITQDPNGNNPTAPNPYAGYDIYASGFQGSFGVLWKNGKILYSDPFDYDALRRTGDFYIAGTDIYEGAEKQYRSTSDYATNIGGCLLKNGAILYNDTGAGTGIYDVIFSGTDVYYLTQERRGGSVSVSKPKIWKNGQVLYDLFALVNNNNQGFFAYSLQIVNNNVFVGCQLSAGERGYFKNGVYNRITQPFAYNDDLTDILLVTQTEDIYLKLNSETRIGLSYPQIVNKNFKIFENGFDISSSFQTTANKTYGTQMKIAGDNFYLLGYDNQKNAIWKNGVRTYLPEENAINNLLTDEIYDLNVVDDKVFIAGKIKSKNPSSLSFNIPYPQVWELTSINTNIVAHEVEVSSTIYSSESYRIAKLVVVKK